MPTYRITGPDGRKFKISGPNKEGALAALQAQLAGAATQPAPDTSMGTAFKVGEAGAVAATQGYVADANRQMEQGPVGRFMQLGEDYVAKPIADALGIDRQPRAAAVAESQRELDANYATSSAARDKLLADTNYQSLTTDDINGVGSFLRYGGQKIAESAGPMAATIATGGTLTMPMMAGEVNENLKDIEGLSEEDRIRLATGGGVIGGVLENLGVGYLFKGVSKEALSRMGVAGVSRVLEKNGLGRLTSRVAAGVATEGLTEAAQEGVSIGAEAIGGRDFTAEDVKSRLFEAGVAGGVAGGGFRGAASIAGGVTDSVKSAPREDTPENRANASFAQRIQRISTTGDLNGVPFNLKDVNSGSSHGVRAAMDASHTDLVGQIADDAKVLRASLTSKDTDPFDLALEKVQAQVGIKMAKNKTKSVVTKDNFDALEKLVGHTEEGQNLLNLVRESQVLTTLHNNEYKGGVSRFTDFALPFDNAQNGYNVGAQVARNITSPSASLGLAMYTGGGSIPYQAGVVAAGRGIDAVTGRRSRVNRFVNKNKDAAGLEIPAGLPSVRKGRIDAAQLAADQKAASEAASAASLAQRTERLKQTNLGLAKKNAPPVPTSPQGTVEAATGLNRSGVARILRVVEATNQDPLIGEAIEAYRGTVAVGGRVPDISPLIRTINQMVESQPAFKQMRVREPDTGVAQAAATGSPIGTPPENYQRGIDDNKAMLQDLKDGAKTDPTMSPADKTKILSALDEMGLNLGTDPAGKVNEILSGLDGVDPDAVAAYVEPYAARVMGQQDAAPRSSAKVPPPTFSQNGSLGTKTPVVNGQIDAEPNETKHGLLPHLRVRADAGRDGKPLLLAGTNNKNASKQIDGIDEVLQRHPDPASSPKAWADMMGDALATDDVPVQPNGFIDDINNGGAQKLLSKLTSGQIADADHGFRNAAEFRKAYVNGEIGIADTGRLFLWSFLSRGVSPYTQESLFMDSFSEIGQWINMAAGKSNRGSLESNLKEYSEWVKTVAPKGSGKPGAGATHNLNAFGNLFLVKMSQDAGLGDGRSRLQVIHDMMSSPDTTGKEIRRQFMRMGDGVGIDNKVVSFTLLVAGFDDVMVLDRVQMRQMWNDGRFDGINLYDGYKSNGKPVTGSALSGLTYGARGLLIYEAMEQSLASRLPKIYQDLGRPEAASVGRYHWETWVASSEQEASHGSIDAILAQAKGEPNPLDGVTAKEGEYGAYAYGARYGIVNNQPTFTYTVPNRGEYTFTVSKFREFLEDIKKAKSKVVPPKFLVTQSGNAPWYTRDGVNLDALAEKAEEHGKQVRRTDGELRQDQPVPIVGSTPTTGEQVRQSVQNGSGGGILSGTSPTPNNPIASSPPKVAEVKQEATLANASIEIGKAGSEFENGIKDLAGVQRLAEAYNVVIKYYNSNADMQDAVPSVNENAMGVYQQRERVAHVVRTGDLNELVTTLHETLHGVGVSSVKTGNFLGELKTQNGLTGRPDVYGGNSIEGIMDFVLGKAKNDPYRREVLAELKHIQERAEFSSGGASVPIRGAKSMAMMLKTLKKEYADAGVDFAPNRVREQKRLKDHQNYERSIGELTVDALILYAHDPKTMKRVAPATAQLIRDMFRKAGNKKIQFYSHPLAMVVAVVMAILAKSQAPEEEEQQQMPAGALSPQRGMLTA